MEEKERLKMDRESVTSITAIVLCLWIVVAFLILVLFAGTASAQVADSLDVEIVAFPTSITLEGPARVSATSQVTYRITVEPPEASAHIIWSLTNTVTAEPVDSAVAYFVEWNDSTATVQVGDSPGLFEVKAEAVPLDSIIIGRIDGDSIDFSDPFRLAKGESAQLCAYGFSGDRALWVHPAPTCHPSSGFSWPTEPATGIHQRIAPLHRPVQLPEDDREDFEEFLRRVKA